jgi:hypothetical protein
VAARDGHPTVICWFWVSRKEALFFGKILLEAIGELQLNKKCHSERSEESCFFKELRSFTSFRMKKNRFCNQFYDMLLGNRQPPESSGLACPTCRLQRYRQDRQKSCNPLFTPVKQRQAG